MMLQSLVNQELSLFHGLIVAVLGTSSVPMNRNVRNGWVFSKMLATRQNHLVMKMNVLLKHSILHYVIFVGIFGCGAGILMLVMKLKDLVNSFLILLIVTL
mmetsp:Transcript_67592/g.188632  ORF Transcript_67592/g.188632 Transcript_67592/m.188632 type:complete len:101 (-) Transcript_67592:988-1290(-)